MGVQQLKATVWQQDSEGTLREVTVSAAQGQEPEMHASSIEMLTLEDAAMGLGLHEFTPAKSAPMRTRHHEVARLLALGYSHVQISAVMGISPQTIWMLKGNPAFQDLLTYYMSERDKAVRDVSGRIESLAMSGLDRLQDFLESPDAAPALVREVAMNLLDRAGYSPVKKKEVRAMHTVLTAEDLKEIRNGSSAVVRRPAKVIDLVPSAAGGEGAPDGEVSAGGTLEVIEGSGL